MVTSFHSKMHTLMVVLDFVHVFSHPADLVTTCNTCAQGKRSVDGLVSGSDPAGMREIQHGHSIDRSYPGDDAVLGGSNTLARRCSQIDSAVAGEPVLDRWLETSRDL